MENKKQSEVMRYFAQQSRFWEEELRKEEEAQRRRAEEWEASKRQEEARRRLLMLRENSRECFLRESEEICFDMEGSISSQRLYALYRRWCREQNVLEQTPRAFSLFVKKNAARYNLVYSMNIPNPEGGHVRGYRGIREKAAGEQPRRAPHTSPASCG